MLTIVIRVFFEMTKLMILKNKQHYLLKKLCSHLIISLYESNNFLLALHSGICIPAEILADLS